MAATEAQQQQWQQQFGGPSFPQPALEEIRTLWVGDLQYWMDEAYLRNLFAHTGEVMSVKVIRNKLTGYPEGYGFVEFNTHGAAESVLQTYNGTQMPQSEQSFRLNWASSGMGDKRVDAGSELSIFVGDLAPDVTDYILHDTFRTRFPSVRGAKVVIDSATGRTKGYGFVRFGDENERSRAMVEMNGMYCSSRPMRISAATPKKAQAVTTTTTTTTTLQPTTTPYTGTSPAPTTTLALQVSTYASPTAPLVPQAFAADNDPTNTTIFVGGLDPNVGEDELRQTFSQFGELVYVKIPLGKGCGFVQFAQRYGRKYSPCSENLVSRSNAEDALHRLHGIVIGQQPIRLSWGRSPSTKPLPTSPWGGDTNQQQWSYYGYQGYEGYGYTPPQDAYAAYPGYGAYGQHMDMHVEEIFDPLSPVDIDRLNAIYMTSRESSFLGRNLWLRTSDQVQSIASH